MAVRAPVAGRAISLDRVPDAVFAQAMVGPGAAIDPVRAPGVVLSPVSGILVKLKPHAFVVTATDGRGVLVHLGIDTVNLDGGGFVLLAEEGGPVLAGAPVVRWNPAAIEAAGLSPVCPVIALDADPASAAAIAASVALGPVSADDRLFTWA
ncbi:PTS sugar transporter subunit IIA [Actinospica durhamensis]|uniref:PTS sugar transporter subunit IIA n=1 Tax=Actinospica durhamensis TaxID=1508375 RepID=UPI001FE4C0C3